MLKFTEAINHMHDKKLFRRMFESGRKTFLRNYDVYGPKNYKTEKFKYLSELAYLLFCEEYRMGVDVKSSMKSMYKNSNKIFDKEDTAEYIKAVLHTASVHLDYDLTDLEPDKKMYHYRPYRVEGIVRRSFRLHE